MYKPEVVASNPFLVTFYFYLLRQDFSSSLQLTDLNNEPMSFRHCSVSMLTLYVGSAYLNSAVYVCLVATLLLSPLPCSG